MNWRQQITLVGLLASVGIHGYLVSEYYPLHYGLGGGESICNINAVFDCSAVSASAYSAVFGVPIAAFGAAFNLIMLLYFATTFLGLVKNKERAQRELLWMATASVVASVIMGAISVIFLTQYCIFCIAAYVTSLVVFYGLMSDQTKGVFSFLKSDIISWFTGETGHLVRYGLAIAAAFFIHAGMKQNYGASALGTVIDSSINEWRQETVNELTVPPTLSKGAAPADAKMTIAEYADFLCGHCRQAAPSLSAFVKSRPDVRLLFYTFPLDGSCNPAIQQRNEVSCYLARTVYCANQQNLGWEMHDLIFANQANLHRTPTIETTESEIKKFTSHLANLDWAKMSTCQQDPQVNEAIKAQAQQGERAKVRGTPSIFVNGRLLERGQLIPVLEGLHSQIK